MSGATLHPVRVACVCRLLAIAGLAAVPAAADENALEAAAPVATPSSEAPSTTLGSIVIEAEPLTEPDLDTLQRRLGTALERDRQRYPLEIVEHQFAGGGLEVDTRYGRFCIAPLPSYLSSGLGADTTLTSRCTAF
jgi:hypothetical protein